MQSRVYKMYRIRVSAVETGPACSPLAGILLLVAKSTKNMLTRERIARGAAGKKRRNEIPNVKDADSVDQRWRPFSSVLDGAYRKIAPVRARMRPQPLVILIAGNYRRERKDRDASQNAPTIKE